MHSASIADGADSDVDDDAIGIISGYDEGENELGEFSWDIVISNAGRFNLENVSYLGRSLGCAQSVWPRARILTRPRNKDMTTARRITPTGSCSPNTNLDVLTQRNAEAKIAATKVQYVCFKLSLGNLCVVA